MYGLEWKVKDLDSRVPGVVQGQSLRSLWNFWGDLICKLLALASEGYFGARNEKGSRQGSRASQ